MPRTHRPYPAEFRRRMVEPVRSGRSVSELGRAFGPSAESIRLWVRRADLDGGVREDGLTSAERKEVRRLRRKNQLLREE